MEECDKFYLRQLSLVSLLIALSHDSFPVNRLFPSIDLLLKV